MHPNQFFNLVQREAALNSRDEAEEAVRVVFHLLSHRLTAEEVADVKAQLPHDLKDVWAGGKTWMERILSQFTPQYLFDRDEFLEEIDERKGGIQASASQIARAVFYALQAQISVGEAQDIASQLPRGLRELWESSRALSPETGVGGGAHEVETPEAEYQGPYVS